MTVYFVQTHHEIQPDPADIFTARAYGVGARIWRHRRVASLDQVGAVFTHAITTGQGDWDRLKVVYILDPNRLMFQHTKLNPSYVRIKLDSAWSSLWITVQRTVDAFDDSFFLHFLEILHKQHTPNPLAQEPPAEPPTIKVE